MTVSSKSAGYPVVHCAVIVPRDMANRDVIELVAKGLVLTWPRWPDDVPIDHVTWYKHRAMHYWTHQVQLTPPALRGYLSVLELSFPSEVDLGVQQPSREEVSSAADKKIDIESSQMNTKRLYR
ncbi:hypothetical protein CDAR_87611, partial [Caerostris darwini]